MPGYSPGGNITSRPLIYGQQNQGGVYQSNGIGVQGSNKGPGFAFQKRNQRVDWRKLASVDVERVARDVDVAALQDNILNVAFCDIQSEMDVRGVDYNFLKLFLLAQLMIEYLLHSQEYLQSYIAESEGKVQEIIQGQDSIRSELDKKSEAYRNLKKEYHKTKKLLGEYQLMVRAGASGAHRCPYCSKSFMSDDFLRSHIERRHAETTPSKPVVASLPEQEKTQLLEEIQKISVRLQMTEAKLQTEAEERNKLILQQREADVEQIREVEREQRLWKEQEELRMKEEMEKYKDMIMQELKDVHSQKEAAETALKDLQHQYGTKRTMIGDLEDVDGGPEKRIQVLKDDFSGQIQALKESYQEELQRLERKFRNREEIAKTEYEGELHKSRVLLEKYENVLNEQKKSSGKTDLEQREKMVNLVEKVKDLERIVEEQKSKQSTPALTLSQLEKTPPAPPPRSPQAAVQRLKTPSDRGDLDTNDLIAFWVSSLNNQNFRVWKSSSSSKSDWKDVFSFNACAKPVGDFDFPVYVYSAGGSPYWRQYVSSQPNPPRSHYKQDFVFYVSRSELLGTTRVHVLDSGSGAVIKSMLSRNSQMEGWKSKGLSFYVLKPKAGGGKFVSFTSTLEETESGDDVSVSSFTATDEAKKNLAEVLKRSREDLVKAVGENLDDEENLDSEEDDEDLDRDEADGDHLAQSSSTSLWGSTLIETGTYRPFKNNPLAVAQYNHSAETIDVCRNEAMESLDHILSNYGVDPDATRMPMRQYQAKMKIHENRVQQLALEKDDFLSKRRKVESSLNDLVEERFNVRNLKNEDMDSSSSAPSKRKPTFKTAATAVRSVTKLTRPPDTNSLGASQTMSSTGSYEQLSTNEEIGRAQHSPRQPIRSAMESFPQTTRGKPSSRLHRAEEMNETPYGNNDLSESEGWDSEQMSDEDYTPSPTAQLPRVTVSKPTLSSQTPMMKQRAARGEKVRELAASLEASLSSRDSTKKLAGAVDLHRQDHLPDEPAQRRRGPLKSSPIRDDFDDGSDFSLSSLEDRGNQSKNTEKRDDDSDLEASVEDALRGVLRSRPGLQGDRPSATATPVRTISSQRPASKVTIVDDFDDDSDLELQHIP